MHSIPRHSILEQPSGVLAPPAAPTSDSSSSSSSCWVTCYGFPAGRALELVQQHFEQQRGLHVVDYFPKTNASTSNSSNFLRIRFQSAKEVAVALGEHGRVMQLADGSQLMMGVSLFKDGDQLGSVPPPAPPAASSKPVADAKKQQKPATPWERALVWIMDL